MLMSEVVSFSLGQDQNYLPQTKSHSSLYPARVKQSIPSTIAVAPEKGMQAIRAYFRVNRMTDVRPTTMIVTATNMPLPALFCIRPLSLIVSNHMLRQKPPRKQPAPSVIWAKGDEIPPIRTDAAIVPATYPAAWPSLLPGSSTKTIRH